MPPDIRSFFGGHPSQGSQTKAPPEKSSVTKKGRPSRKVLDDSDEEELPKKTAPKKAPARKREPTPEGQVTTTSDYFGNEKPKKSAPVKASTQKTKAADSTPKATPVKTKSTPQNRSTPKSRTSSRKKSAVVYREEQDDNGMIKLDDDDEDKNDDIFTAAYRTTGRGFGDDYEEGSEGDAEPSQKSVRNGRQTKVKKEEDFKSDDDVDMKDIEPEETFLVPDDSEGIQVNNPAKGKRGTATAGRKRKSQALDEDEDEDGEDFSSKKAKGKKAAPKKSPAKKKVKKDDVPESTEMQAIFDSIPTIRAPTPPARDGESKKFDFSVHQANAAPPASVGAKDIPDGADNCLAGLSFVFTGLLETLGREQGQALIKRYGGKCVGAPSSKTSYVILGSDAGPKKLETIQKYKIKTINEDGLFELIRRLPANGGDSKAATKNDEKKQAEIAKVQKLAEEAEEEERKAETVKKKKNAASAAATGSPRSNGKGSTSDTDTRLWTVKHAPTQISQICGNKQPVERLQRWLRAFPKNQRTNFKLAGADGSGTFRAVIIHGPPGIGKTTAAHLVAKLEGYDMVETNASDARSKKLVEQGLRGVLSTTSLLGYFAGDGDKVEASKKKLVLIMDEVDGMSAGDRGGVGALAAVCKKTQIPMILICNDRKQPKMKPFDFVTFDIPFRRPTTDMIRSRIMTIGFREGIKLPPNVIDALIEGTGADIRQVVNMLSTAKLDQTLGDDAMNYDAGKKMSKAWEKNIIMKPFEIVSKILGGGMFASSSKATLNDKIELYFHDHDISSLMLAENYLGTSPIILNAYSGREKALKGLELAEKAANSISEGDLVDRMIHGPEQQWSLMPTHAVLSFVRPASFVAGSLAGHQTRFPQWLGKNSSQGKSIRQIKEIQGHMRLRSSGDRHEIRQQYVPLLWSYLIKKLEVEGKDCVPGAIELMDSYFLTKDDWDAILELGVGPMAQESVKLESQTKATFTRLYNSQAHPLPFMKARDIAQPKKQTKDKPDLEEAFEGSDDEEDVEDIKKEEEDGEADLSKDKYVAKPKKKKAPAKPAAAKGKAKAKKGQDDEDDEESDNGGKTKKGVTAAKGQGRAKK